MFPLPRRWRAPRSAAVALVVVSSLASVACSGAEAGTSSAVAAFEAFQDALFAKDLPRIRELVTAASRPAVPQLPLQRLAGRQRLQVVGAHRRDPFVILDLRDPSAPSRTRTYVVAREGGRWLVDLLETVGYEHEDKPVEGGGPHFEPRPLSPEEQARIRAEWSDELR